MGATGAGAAGDGSAAAGRGICGDCAGPGRYGAGAGEQDSAGDVVPIQAGGGEDAVQLVVVGARGYAQSAAAVVLECSARHAEAAGGTVLRGFEFQVRRERERRRRLRLRHGSRRRRRGRRMRRGMRTRRNAHRALYACAWAAEFPAQALLRLRTDWQTEPVVVLDGRAPEEWVCSLNRLAERRGAAAGMTRLEAESMLGLRLLKRSAESEAAARAVMLECAAKFSPRIEEARQVRAQRSRAAERRARLCWTLRARSGCLGRRHSWRSG